MGNSINISKAHHKILREEFSQVSRQTIHAALKYFNNSEIAMNIRSRAKELLSKEIANINEIENKNKEESSK